MTRFTLYASLSVLPFLIGCGEVPLQGASTAADTQVAGQVSPTALQCSATTVSQSSLASTEAFVSASGPLDLTVQIACNEPVSLLGVVGTGNPSFGPLTEVGENVYTTTGTLPSSGAQTVEFELGNPSVQGAETVATVTVNPQGATGVTTLSCQATAAPNIVTVKANSDGTIGTTSQSSQFSLSILTNTSAVVTSVTTGNGANFTMGTPPSGPSTSFNVSGNFFTGVSGLVNLTITVAQAGNSASTATCTAAVAITTTNTTVTCTASANTTTVTVPVNANGQPVASTTPIDFTITSNKGKATISQVEVPTGAVASAPNGLNATATFGTSLGAQPFAFLVTDNGDTTVCAVSIIGEEEGATE